MSHVALVTGGSRGIGKAIAMRLAGDGHSVAVNYTANASAADEVVDAITAAGGAAIAVQADVGDTDAVAAMFGEIEERLGRVGILVNNAGITRDDLLMRMSPDAWDDVIQTNLRSVYLCTRAAMRGMLRLKWGRIISREFGVRDLRKPRSGQLRCFKGGDHRVLEVGRSRNRIPQYHGQCGCARLHRDGHDRAARDEVAEQVIRRVALGRLGKPEEIAAAVGYLASDDAAYVTGQTLVVDGGLAL